MAIFTGVGDACSRWASYTGQQSRVASDSQPTDNESGDVEKLRRLLLSGEQQTVPTRVLVYGCCDAALLKALLGALHRLLLDGGDDDGRSLQLFADLSVLRLNSDDDGQTFRLDVDGARVPIYNIPLSADLEVAKACLGRNTMSGADLLIVSVNEHLESSWQRIADLTPTSRILVHIGSVVEDLAGVAAKLGLVLYGHGELFGRRLAIFSQSPSRYFRRANVEADADWLNGLQLIGGGCGAVCSWLKSCQRNLYVLVDAGAPKCAVLVQTIRPSESLENVSIDAIDEIATEARSASGSVGLVVIIGQLHGEFSSDMLQFALQILSQDDFRKVCVIHRGNEISRALSYDYCGWYQRQSPKPLLLKNIFRSGDGSLVKLFKSKSSKLIFLQDCQSASLPRLMRAKQDNHVAIFGASCIFANSSTNFSSYWDMLISGRDGVVGVPQDRTSLSKLGLDASGRLFKGGFLSRPVAAFDAQFFSTSPLEAKFIDPQQRILLEVIWHAIEDCGIRLKALQTAATSVCVGMGNSDYMNMVDHSTGSNMTSFFGSFLPFAAGRPAYHLGLGGSSIVVDTACSTALTVISIAVDSILSSRETFAIVATANLLLSREFVGCSWKDGLLASDSHCKSFDAAADGFARAEGFAALLLAERASVNQLPYGIIKATAVNHDGASSGLTAPNGAAQQVLIQKALQQSGSVAADVQYVECHGTGTAVGDPIEARALCNVFADNGLLHLGASKTNVGHSEASAGMAGILKALKAQNSHTIPQQLHFGILNPKIELNNNEMQVGVITEAFHGSANVLSGVSAFGISGSNAHTIISLAEEAEVNKCGAVSNLAEIPYNILPLAAKSTTALASLCAQFQAAQESGWYSGYDMAHKSSTSREQFKHRTAIVGKEQRDMAQKLKSVVAQNKHKAPANGELSIGFLFSGKVFSLSTMGKQLYSLGGEYKLQFDRCVSHINGQSDVPLLQTYDEGIAEPTCEAFAQPLQFAMSYSLAQQWNKWGIEPTCVIGHSLGELAATVSAGILSFEDACKVVASMGKLSDACAGGSMGVIAAGSESISQILQHFDQIDLATENCPQQSAIAGSRTQLRQIACLCATIGLRYFPIDVNVAFHSRELGPAAPLLLAVTQTLNFTPAAHPLYCNLSGKRVTALDAGYLPQELMLPVRFNTGATQMLNDGVHTLVEASPRPVLLSFLAAIAKHLRKADILLVPSWKDCGDEAETMAEGLAKLFAAGFQPDFAAFYGGGSGSHPARLERGNSRPRRVPQYQFVQGSHWAPMKEEGRVTKPEDANQKGATMQRNAVSKESIKEAITRSLKAAMHLSADVVLDENERFVSMGLDSLMAVDFINRLQQHVDGAELSPATLFEQNTIASLCNHMTGKLRTKTPAQNTLKQSVADALRAVLQLPNNHEFDETEEFLAMGMNSLLVIEFCNKLEDTFDKQLPRADIFQQNTIEKLCAFLAKLESSTVLTEPEIEVVATKRASSIANFGTMGKSFEFPFSFPQQRLWYWSKVSEDAAKHMMAFSIVFTEKLNSAALQGTLGLLIAKHGSLRMVPTREVHTKGLQTYRSYSENHHKLSVELQSVRASRANNARWFQQPFDAFDTAGLMRSELLCNCASTHCRFSLICHHLICDGSSFAILLKKLPHLYRLALQGEQIIMPKQQATYCDFTLHQSQLIYSDHIEQQLKYWQSELRGYEQLSWPTDRALPPIKCAFGVELLFQLTAPTSNAVRAQCSNAAVTMFTAAFSSFCLLISEWCQQNDFLVGSASDNRSAETNGIFGYLANNMAIRVRIGETSTKEFVEKMQNVLFEAFRRKDVPYEHILENLRLRRDFHLSQLVQVLFIMVPLHTRPAICESIVDASMDTNNMVEFDQTWHLRDYDTGVVGKLKYVEMCNTAESMNAVVRHFTHNLTHSLKNASTVSCTNGLFMGNCAGRAQNGVPRLVNRDMHRLHGVMLRRGLVRQAELTPNGSAGRLPRTTEQSTADLSFTAANFGQFRRAAILKLQFLKQCNQTQPTVIALARNTDKPANFYHTVVACIIAGYTVKLGNMQRDTGAHQEFDVSAMSYLLPYTRQASRKLTINNEISITILKNHREFSLTSIAIVKMAAHLTSSHFIPLHSRITIIFGAPEISTESLLYGAFSAILNGCCSVFTDCIDAVETAEARPEFALGSWTSAETLCRDMPLTLQNLRAFSQRYLATENVFFGGHANDRLGQFFSFGKAGGWHTSRAIGSSTVQANVGSVLPTINLTIVDKVGQTCPYGVPGELCECGRGGMPFCEGMGITAKMLPDRTVWHIANQTMVVSLKGLRVDLAVIECALMDTKEIQTCAVVCHGLKLIGFYVLNPGFSGSFTEGQLKFSLCKSLPACLIPSRLVRLNSLPVNNKGTFDRNFLSTVQLPQNAENMSISDVEQKLLTIWRSNFEIIDLEIDENIFERNWKRPITFWYEAASLACTAIKESELVSKDFELTTIFSHPTVSLFYQYISSV